MPTTTQSIQEAADYWASSVRFNNFLVIVAFTILYYDYILTLFREIEHFWRTANVTIVSVLFVVVRYYGLLGSIPIAVEYFSDLSEQVCNDTGRPKGRLTGWDCLNRCRQFQTYHQGFAISSQAIVAITLVTRTYALYDRSKRILALLIVTHVGGAVACLIAMVTTKSPVQTTTPLPFTFTGCNLSLTDAQGIHLALAWSAMLWFDTTIFVLTLIKALQIRRHFPGGLLEIMFRDGTIYYGIMVASNVSNIITFMITRSGSPLKGMDTTLTNVLSTTLTSRLILNVRDPALRRTPRTTEDNTMTAWNESSAMPTTSYTTSRWYTLTQIEAGMVDSQTTEDQEEISQVLNG